MRYLVLFIMILIPMLATSQNSVFRAALVSELNKLNDQEEIIVEYKKTGGWGDYEGGYITYRQNEGKIFITLTNTDQYNKKSETTYTAYDKRELIARLNKAEDKIQDENNIAINNKIHYNITKNGVSLAKISADLEPDQVINKVQLDPNLSGFFKKEKNKKAGILINNMNQ